jgi:hypothetical protein
MKGLLSRLLGWLRRRLVRSWAGLHHDYLRFRFRRALGRKNGERALEYLNRLPLEVSALAPEEFLRREQKDWREYLDEGGRIEPLTSARVAISVGRVVLLVVLGVFVVLILHRLDFDRVAGAWSVLQGSSPSGQVETPTQIVGLQPLEDALEPANAPEVGGATAAEEHAPQLESKSSNAQPPRREGTRNEIGEATEERRVEEVVGPGRQAREPGVLLMKAGQHLRESPKSGAPELVELEKDMRLPLEGEVILADGKVWVSVLYPAAEGNAGRGWFHIEIKWAKADADGLIVEENRSLRREPTTDGSRLRLLEAGERVTLTGRVRANQYLWLGVESEHPDCTQSCWVAVDL